MSPYKLLMFDSCGVKPDNCNFEMDTAQYSGTQGRGNITIIGKTTVGILRLF